MESPITKGNLPDWIRSYGINWVHNHYILEEPNEQILLEYLEKNGELVGVILSVLAILKRSNPAEEIFTQAGTKPPKDDAQK